MQNVTDHPQTGNLHGTFADVSFDYPVTLAPNESKIVNLTPAEIPQLHVNQPLLWWPNGYGPQNLYKLHLSFDVDGAISDAKDLTFGIRKITYDVPGSKNLTLSVNGVPVMCKGGDWGMDEAMKRIPRDRLEAQIRMHQDANFNMIRNWVGQSTSDDFYDLCDQYGIMVWDEFFQPNRSDGPNVVSMPTCISPMSATKILRYRIHPSIVIWCGRNESDPAPEVIDRGIQQNRRRARSRPALPPQFRRRPRRPLRRPLSLARRRASFTPSPKRSKPKSAASPSPRSNRSTP